VHCCLSGPQSLSAGSSVCLGCIGLMAGLLQHEPRQPLLCTSGSSACVYAENEKCKPLPLCADLAQRESSSCHLGSAFRDYIAAQQQQEQQQEQQQQQQQGGGSMPGPLQPWGEGSSHSRTLGPALTFSGGRFRLAEAGGSEGQLLHQDPSASGHGQGRGLRRAVTLQPEHTLRTLRSPASMQPHKEPSTGAFKLFGDVDLGLGEGGPVDGVVEEQAPSFRLFGDVQELPLEEDGDLGGGPEEQGAGQQQAPPFRLFGDVEELPLEGGEDGDAAEQGAG
jgi:hypothetical protein